MQLSSADLRLSSRNFIKKLAPAETSCNPRSRRVLERLYWSSIKQEKQRASCTYMTVINRSLRKLPWSNIWHRVCLSVGSHSAAVKDRRAGRRSEFDKTAPGPRCKVLYRGWKPGNGGGTGGGRGPAGQRQRERRRGPTGRAGGGKLHVEPRTS